jgi:hypothetical protein
LPARGLAGAVEDLLPQTPPVPLGFAVLRGVNQELREQLFGHGSPRFAPILAPGNGSAARCRFILPHRGERECGYTKIAHGDLTTISLECPHVPVAL